MQRARILRFYIWHVWGRILYHSNDNFSAPHITPKPNKPGKVYWLSGPPGAGKSTTAQLLAKDHDFIYYEADAFFMFCNPFIDPKTDNPSMATLSQKPLKVHTEQAKSCLT